ncbi:hypothetical protein SHIRM173S_01805 [Streptomyces hirsutus]
MSYSHSVIASRLPSWTTSTSRRAVERRAGESTRSSFSFNSPMSARIRSLRDGKYA